MPLVRPIVYVFQEFATLTVQPGIPDLNCCIVGPAFYIQDYATDKASIGEGEFTKSGETVDAPCTATGRSAGQPDDGSNFLVLSEPPNISGAPGALLDATSVDLTFDDVRLELAKGINGVAASGGQTLTSAGASFDTGNISVGDWVILTNTSNPGDSDKTVARKILSIDSATQLTFTDLFSSDDITKIGTTAILYRVETDSLSDQTIDSAYWSVNGQEITILTGAQGIRLTYAKTGGTAATYPVTYAAGIYIGYRASRQDLQDVRTIDTINDIVSAVGRIDERNPLAVGVFVAMSNTGTPVQAFGVATDDLIGQTAARDALSNRSDIYAIVPVTGELTGATWTPVISMWKAHCADFATSDKSKYRIVIGSYDILPTEKASAPASDEGYTLLDPVNISDFDVFVDPHADTQFITDEVSSSHLLDIAHGHADMRTLTTDTPFTAGSTPYGGAKALLGAMGQKRLRVAAADKFSGEHVTAEDGNYVIRDPLLKSEGGSTIADTSAVTLAIDGVTSELRITKTGAFANVLVGDVAHVTGCTTPSNEGGFIVLQKLSSDEIEVAWGVADAGLAVAVQVYRPLGSGADSTATVTATTATIACTGAFSNAAIGDMVYIIRVSASGIPGMFLINNVVDDDSAVISVPGGVSLADDADIDIAIFRPVSSNPSGMSLYGRRRLTRLQDNSASFITSVAFGENIEIPYPAETDPTKWDTSTTQWPIKTIVANQLLDATLTDLQELAPKLFVNGFTGDMDYRISIDLDRAAQVTELNTIPTALKSNRCVMAWPNECYVSSVENEMTGTQSKQGGWYLACAIGGMIAGLPSHQGFTFISIGGIQQIFNSNFYFTSGQIDDLSSGGWYVFLQDSESSAPYSAAEFTTDTDTYEMGELMAVKNFDFVSMFYKDIMEVFLGRYNINNETLDMIQESFDSGTQILQLKTYPKIGAPLLSAEITSLEQLAGERDRVEIFAELSLPTVLNKIGLHLKA